MKPNDNLLTDKEIMQVAGIKYHPFLVDSLCLRDIVQAEYDHLIKLGYLSPSEVQAIKEELRMGNVLYAELTEKYNDKDFELQELKRSVQALIEEAVKELYEALQKEGKE